MSLKAQPKDKEQVMHAGVKFIDPEDLVALQSTGVYETVISAELAGHVTHPDVGDTVGLLLDDSSAGRRITVRLVSEEKLSDGRVKSTYQPLVGEDIGKFVKGYV